MVVLTVVGTAMGRCKVMSMCHLRLCMLARLLSCLGLPQFSGAAGVSGGVGTKAVTTVAATAVVTEHQRPRKNKASSSRSVSWRQVGRPWLHWSERSVTSIWRSRAFISSSVN